jgi:iron complex transport system ATP-binding protein
VSQTFEISTKGLKLPFGSCSISSLNWTAQAGQCWAILGNNGSGKTLLIERLAGFTRDASVAWQGVDPTQLSPSQWQAAVSFQPASIQEPFDDRVLHRVMAINPEVTSGQALQVLEQLGLAGASAQWWSNLSAGQRQRAWLAQRLLQDSHALLLDEPLSHQDIHQQENLGRVLNQVVASAKLVVVVAHQLDWAARYCTHVLGLTIDGQYLAGPVSQMLSQDNLLKLYGHPFKCVVVDDQQRFVPA